MVTPGLERHGTTWRYSGEIGNRLLLETAIPQAHLGEENQPTIVAVLLRSLVDSA